MKPHPLLEILSGLGWALVVCGIVVSLLVTCAVLT